MADDQNIKITFDTNAGKAALDVNKLAGGLDNVDDSAAGANKAFKNLDATFDEVYGDLKPLTARMGEAEDRLYELALAGETAGDEYDALLKKVANYRKTQIETDKVVDAAATTLGQKLAGASQLAATGISAVTSGLALFGPVSEDTEKALLKVQAAMAFADSISSLADMQAQFKVFQGLVVDGYKRIVIAKQAEIAATTQATIAQRLLNITALANPYVLAGAAIAAVTIATYAWVKASNEEATALKIATNAVSLNKVETENLASSIEETAKATEGYNSLEVARARALGATDIEIQKIIQSQKELQVTTSRTFATEAYNNVLKAMEAARAARSTMDKDLIKDAEDNQKQAEDIYRKANDSFNSAIISEAENRLNTQADNNKKELDEAKRLADERKKIAEEAYKAEQELIRMRGEAAREAYEKELSDFEIFKSRLIDARIQSDIDDKERQLESLEETTSEINSFLEADSAEKDRIDKIKEQNKKESDDRIISNSDRLVENAKLLAGKNKTIQRAAIIAEGGINIGKTISNTATAIASDLKLGFPANIAPIALDVAVGATSVASIVKGTNDSLKAIGGGSIAGAVPTSGISAGSASAPSVQFNNTAENQIAQATAKAQADQPPITVTVNESDITKAQNNVKTLVKTNTF